MHRLSENLIEAGGSRRLGGGIDTDDLERRVGKDVTNARQKRTYFDNLLVDCLGMSAEERENFEKEVLARWYDGEGDENFRERLRLQLEAVQSAERLALLLTQIESRLSDAADLESLSWAIGRMGRIGDFLESGNYDWPEYRTTLLYMQGKIVRFLGEKENAALDLLKYENWDQVAVDNFLNTLREYVVIIEDTKHNLHLDFSKEQWLNAWDSLFRPTGSKIPEEQRKELLRLVKATEEEMSSEQRKYETELKNGILEELQQAGIDEEWVRDETKLKKLGEFVWEQIKVTGKSFLGLRPKAIIKNIIDHPEVYGAAALGFVAKSAVKGALGKGLFAGAAVGGLFGAGIGVFREVKQKSKRRREYGQFEQGLYDDEYKVNFESLWKRPAAEALAILLTLENNLKEKRNYLNKLGDNIGLALLDERISFLDKQKELIAQGQALKKEKGVDRLFKYIEMSKALENLEPSKRELFDRMDLGKRLRKLEKEAKKDIDVALGKRVNLRAVAGSTFRGAAVGFAGGVLGEVFSRFKFPAGADPLPSEVEPAPLPTEHNLIEPTSQEVANAGPIPLEPIEVEIEGHPEMVAKGEGFWQPVERQLKARLYGLATSNNPEDITELKDKYHLAPEEVTSQTPSFEKQVDNIVAEILRDNHIINPENETELRVAKVGEVIVLNEDNTISYSGVTYQRPLGFSEIGGEAEKQDAANEPEPQVDEIPEFKLTTPEQVYVQADDHVEHLSPTMEKAALAWFGTVSIAGTAKMEKGELNAERQELGDRLTKTKLYGTGFIEKLLKSWQSLSQQQKIESILILVNPKNARARQLESPLGDRDFSQFRRVLGRRDYKRALYLINQQIEVQDSYRKDALMLAKDLLHRIVNSKVKAKTT